jgi:hypothetical protein
MTQEQLRMQMLAGIITEGQYKAIINENEDESKPYKLVLGTIVDYSPTDDVWDEFEGMFKGKEYITKNEYLNFIQSVEEWPIDMEREWDNI